MSMDPPNQPPPEKNLTPEQTKYLELSQNEYERALLLSSLSQNPIHRACILARMKIGDVRLNHEQLFSSLQEYRGGRRGWKTI